MGFIFDYLASIPDWVCYLNMALIRVFLILFIVFKSRSRHEKFRVWMYILAVIIPFIGLLVYLARHKETGGDYVKVCPICDTLYPVDENVCTKCNCALPEYKDKKVLRIVSIVFLVLTAFCMVLSASITFGSFSNISTIMNDSEAGQTGMIWNLLV